MRASMFANIMLSALFYTTLLSTLFVLPLVLAARDDAASHNARSWESALDLQAKTQPGRDLRLPQTELQVPSPGAHRAPMDRSGPDAAMIKPVRARAKTIKL